MLDGVAVMTDVSEHRKLVQRAGRWLRGGAKIHADGDHWQTVRCAVVATELVVTHEIPDAIGWAYGGLFSVLVECKTSRADFKADRGKYFRDNPKSGMGRYRYYFTPSGLICVDELPPLWGLLELSGRSVQVIRLADRHEEINDVQERRVLWSLARRCQAECNR